MTLGYSFINDNNTQNKSNITKNQRKKTIKRRTPAYYDDDNEKRSPEIKKVTRDFINKVENDVPMPMEPDYLDDNDQLADFEPIPAPEQNTKSDKPVQNETYNPTYTDTYSKEADEKLDDSIDIETLNKLNIGQDMTGNYVSQYKINNNNNVPYFVQQKNNMTQPLPQLDERLVEKINYMIKLLEDNHDEKTGHVTEELILYGFLGIFIIFVVDSFVRVGKYTR